MFSHKVAWFHVMKDYSILKDLLCFNGGLAVTKLIEGLIEGLHVALCTELLLQCKV